jgi:hypothetical protein
LFNTAALPQRASKGLPQETHFSKKLIKQVKMDAVLNKLIKQVNMNAVSK